MCEWWLRMPGYYSYNAVIVKEYGHADIRGTTVTYRGGGVRPDLWLNL